MGLVVRSYGSDGDHSVQGGALFHPASFRLDADQVSQVLEIEEQQVVPQVQEGQTLRTQSLMFTTQAAILD